MNEREYVFSQLNRVRYQLLMDYELLQDSAIRNMVGAGFFNPLMERLNEVIEMVGAAQEAINDPHDHVDSAASG